jgi:hypothetical protein
LDNAVPTGLRATTDIHGPGTVITDIDDQHFAPQK